MITAEESSRIRPVPLRGFMAAAVHAAAALSVLALVATLFSACSLLPLAPGPGNAVYLCDVGRRNACHVVGHDGGYSLVLPDGSRFWTFGDTWIGEMAQGRRTIRRALSSTGALQRSNDICAPLTYLTDAEGEVRQLLPDAPNSEGLGISNWPMGMAAADGRVYIYYVRTRKTEGSCRSEQAVNFEVLGAGVASAPVDTLEFELENGGELLFTAEEHGFFDALYSDGQYLYGLGCPPRRDMPTRPCRVARVPTTRIADRTAYRYWDGAQWQNDLNRAVFVVDTGSSEMTLTRRGEEFLLTYIPPFSCRVEIRSAPRLTGPWSPVCRLHDAKPVKGGSCYGAKLQEVSSDGKWGVLTWNSNGPLDLHSRKPDLYWPHAVRVELPPARSR